MATFKPFLCRVTDYGTPFFVNLSSATVSSLMSGLSAEEICEYYWLLESMSIAYKMTFSGSLGVSGDLLLGGMYGALPVRRILGAPNFSSALFHSSSGIRSESSVDFSIIYAQDDGLYSIAFDFCSYSMSEGVGGSDFLLSFQRSVGSSGQRNRYKTRNFNFLGKSETVYLNYNGNIWSDDEIELNEFSIENTWFQNI